MKKTIDDFCWERMLQIPDATLLMLEKLIIDWGVELALTPDNYTHGERVCILREIMADLEMRELAIQEEN